MKIKALIIALTLCILSTVCGCQNNTAYEKDAKLYGTHTAVMTIKDYGEVKLELYGDKAPVTVANFVNLIKMGFYNGLTFHRAIDGYMLQGGDPKGDGTGSRETKIYGEFKSNGWENDLSHKRGVLSMARARNKNSASCQFFIMVGDETRLDGDYAAFGKVIEGMEIIDSIMTDVKTDDPNGMLSKAKQPVIERIEMITE